MTVNTRIEVQNLKDNLRILGRIDPALRREFGKRFRQVAQPVVNEINQLRPTSATLPRGFQHDGRTGSGKVKKLKVDLNTRKARNRNIAQGARYETLGTVRVLTQDAPMAIADMAGKVGNISFSGRSRAYPGRPQGHALNGQGAGLIKGLNKYFGSPSRFMWPGAERGFPMVEDEFRRTIREVEQAINDQLKAIGSSAAEVRSKMRG